MRHVLGFRITGDHADAFALVPRVSESANALFGRGGITVQATVHATARAAFGSRWGQQAAGFVEAQVLYAGADEFRGDGDAVDAVVVVG